MGIVGSMAPVLATISLLPAADENQGVKRKQIAISRFLI